MTSTYQRNDISLYNSLQQTIIEILLAVHLDKNHSLFLVYLETLSVVHMTALNDRMVNETELMWK